MRLSDLAAELSAELQGVDREITGVAELEAAGPSELSFFTHPRYRDALAHTAAGAVLVQSFLPEIRPAQLVCTNAYLALARAMVLVGPKPEHGSGIEAGALVHPSALVHATAWIRMGAVVDAGARVGAACVIAPQAYVGRRAVIGDETVLHPGARVLDGCIIGCRVILAAGVVVGSDGFGFAVDAEGHRVKIPQQGIVQVDDDVELGANTTIDRATLGITHIGSGTKIDNLVQVAHNVRIGRDCVLVSQSGVAGSSTLGDRVVMGAQAGIAGHLQVTSDVSLAARAGVSHDVRQKGVYAGFPLQEHAKWQRSAVAQKHTPELLERVRKLELLTQDVERRLK